VNPKLESQNSKSKTLNSILNSKLESQNPKAETRSLSPLIILGKDPDPDEPLLQARPPTLTNT
jgi:hypothetical protein